MIPLAAASILVKATAVTLAALSRAVPVRLQVPLDRLTPGRYDCQVSVLDPSAGRAAFWRAPIVVVR